MNVVHKRRNMYNKRLFFINVQASEMNKRLKNEV